MGASKSKASMATCSLSEEEIVEQFVGILTKNKLDNETMSGLAVIANNMKSNSLKTVLENNIMSVRSKKDPKVYVFIDTTGDEDSQIIDVKTSTTQQSSWGASSVQKVIGKRYRSSTTIEPADILYQESYGYGQGGVTQKSDLHNVYSGIAWTREAIKEWIDQLKSTGSAEFEKGDIVLTNSKNIDIVTAYVIKSNGNEELLEEIGRFELDGAPKIIAELIVQASVADFIKDVPNFFKDVISDSGFENGGTISLQCLLSESSVWRRQAIRTLLNNPKKAAKYSKVLDVLEGNGQISMDFIRDQNGSVTIYLGASRSLSSRDSRKVQIDKALIQYLKNGGGSRFFGKKGGAPATIPTPSQQGKQSQPRYHVQSSTKTVCKANPSVHSNSLVSI